MELIVTKRGEKAGEFYTPQEVSKISGKKLLLQVRIVEIGLLTLLVVQDLLLAGVVREVKRCKQHGQEMNRNYIYNLFE